MVHLPLAALNLLNDIVKLSSVKSCSFPRRSCARVRRASRPAHVAGGPRPSAPASISAAGPCVARVSGV
jgi:hypothetical protein